MIPEWEIVEEPHLALEAPTPPPDDIEEYLHAIPCPRCGCPVNCNGSAVWCSFVGDTRQGIRPCAYGIDKPVSAEQHREGR